ncbi:MAG: 3-deoxy-7-phosphoheptulonate synthase [Erysipelotrichaceae bacterium]|nr:3-deoxy-7-phosphoheptulonate synthase [Erysipelotrichaceae bacterium]
MIISLKKHTPEIEKQKLITDLENQDFQITIIEGVHMTLLALTGDTIKVDDKRILANPWVIEVRRMDVPYKLVSRYVHPEDTIVEVGDVKIGAGQPLVIIGGPCSVEGDEMMCRLAQEVKDAGGKMMRGGAYKPRTSPYAFQGMQTEGIQCMVHAKELTGMPIVSELMSIDKIDEFVANVDIIQVGARNMQNFELLKALGKVNKPILLKRGMANTIEEWLMSAEYIMANGNPNVILCERGIRTFETLTRNTLDVSVIPIIKERTHLPIIIDPSHATGDWKLVEAMSLAAVAAGCDGLMIEVHDQPECAWSDGSQSLKPEKFKALVEKVKKVAEVLGRSI